MVRSQSQKDRDKDKRLQRKFGITLDEHNSRRRQQNDRCKICKGRLDAYGPPNVDHYHFWIMTVRVEDASMNSAGLKWVSTSHDERGSVVLARYAKTKAASRAAVKIATMPWSIRGLLCFKCNRGLGAIEKFFNAARFPDNLLPVIEYFQARINKPLDNIPVL